MKVSRFIFAAICGLIVAASCDKVENDQKGNEFVFNLIPTVETTKTAMNAAGTDVVWQGTEEMATYLNGTFLKSTISSSETFAAKVSSSGSAAVTAGKDYTVQGFVPNSAYVSRTVTDNYDGVRVYKLSLSDTQNPTSSTFDPSADILVAKLQNVTVTEEDINKGTKDVNFFFGRLNAITKINLNVNSSDVISATEIVRRVEIEFPNDVKVSGRFYFDAYSNKFVSTSKSSDNTEITDKRNIFCEGSSNKLTVEYVEGSRPQIGGLSVWAVVPPVTVNGSETITFTVYTDKHKIVKTATPSSAISFSNQKLNTLSLDLSTASVEGAVDEDACHTISWSGSGDWTIANETCSLNDNSDGYSVVAEKNDGTTAPTVNSSANDCRVYAKGTVTVSNEGYAIKKLVFHISTAGLKRLAKITASSGTVSPISSGDSKVVWTAADATTTSVTFTVGDTAEYGSDGATKGGQLDFSSIDAYYASLPETPVEETYSITLKSVENGSVAAEINGVAVSSATAGTVISVVATPSEGYKLGEWDVRDASNKVINVTDGKFTMPASNVTVSASFVVDYQLAVSPLNPQKCSSSAGTKTFNVTSNASDWNVAVASDQNWASVKKEEKSFVVTYSANESETETTVDRSVEITVTSVLAGLTGDKAIKITLSQSGREQVADNAPKYELVTSESNLAEGDVIVLGCIDNKKAAGLMSGEVYLSSVDADITNGILTSNNAAEITLWKEDDNWTLNNSEGTICATAEKKMALGTGTSTWTISIDSDNNASIKSTTSTYGSIQYNSSYPRFLNYSASQSAIQIYKLNDGKTSQRLSFAGDISWTIGETYSVNGEYDGSTLSGANTSVSYASSNTEVVTVSENGRLSIKGAGVAIITATAASTETYREASATYKVSIIPSGGNPATYQHVFASKPSTGNKVSLSDVDWNITATNLGGYNSANYAGVQVGTSKANGQITLTSSDNWAYTTSDGKGGATITEVRLWLNLGGTSVTPSVTIGGVAATSDGKSVVKNSSAGSDWTKVTKVTFTPGANGNKGVLVIDVSTVKAGYICAIEVDCQ